MNHNATVKSAAGRLAILDLTEDDEMFSNRQLNLGTSPYGRW